MSFSKRAVTEDLTRPGGSQPVRKTAATRREPPCGGAKLGPACKFAVSGSSGCTPHPPDRRRRRADVAREDNAGWSLYGAPRLQAMASNRKSRRPSKRQNKPKPLPPVATSCRKERMVSRASAVGCHPLRKVPSLRERRSISLKRQVPRTRGPTGLDGETLTRTEIAVKNGSPISGGGAGASTLLRRGCRAGPGSRCHARPLPRPIVRSRAARWPGAEW